MMRTKFLFIYLFLASISLPLRLISFSFDEKNFSFSDEIPALASLIFHINEWEERLISLHPDADQIIFSDEDIAHLWNKVNHGLSFQSAHFIERLSLFNQAYQFYEQAHAEACQGKIKKARKFLYFSSQLLNQLWQEATEKEIPLALPSSLTVRGQKDPNFRNNPYVSAQARQAMSPYLLPFKHPMRLMLDAIFLKARVTTDEDTFYRAGFEIIAQGPRSYICVAKHNKMPGYLVKAYLDTELKEKFDRKSWQWLVRRCQGASKIRHIIQSRHIRYFIVPDKWIYCLPAEPSPPNDSAHTRHLAVLLVSDMNLTSEKRNYYAWSHDITKRHLDELYEIISRAKGSSYRPDNIAYTKNGKFAFIDTEYPTKGPDFKSIRKYLNSEMRQYWDQLIKHGGH
jgi:hypothetical protein